MLSVIGLPGLIIFSVIWIVPFWILLPKFGLSKWISLAAFLPFVGFILLWVIAFRTPVQPEIKPEVFE